MIDETLRTIRLKSQNDRCTNGKYWLFQAFLYCKYHHLGEQTMLIKEIISAHRVLVSKTLNIRSVRSVEHMEINAQ